MYENEPLVSRINRLMQDLEVAVDRVQAISIELEHIVKEEQASENDWK